MYRLNQVKIDFIENQRKNFSTIGDNLDSLYTYIEKLSRHLNIAKDVVMIEGRESIEWNRFSILDESGKISRYLDGIGVCAGNYNWHSCLHQLIPENSVCIYHGPFPNAEYISQHVVNMPIWYNWWEKDMKINYE